MVLQTWHGSQLIECATAVHLPASIADDWASCMFMHGAAAHAGTRPMSASMHSTVTAYGRHGKVVDTL